MRLRPCSAAQHDVVVWARLSVTLNGNPTFGLQAGLPLQPVNPEPAGLVFHTPLPCLSFLPNPTHGLARPTEVDGGWLLSKGWHCDVLTAASRRHNT